MSDIYLPLEGITLPSAIEEESKQFLGSLYPGINIYMASVPQAILADCIGQVSNCGRVIEDNCNPIQGRTLNKTLENYVESVPHQRLSNIYKLALRPPRGRADWLNPLYYLKTGIVALALSAEFLFKTAGAYSNRIFSEMTARLYRYSSSFKRWPTARAFGGILFFGVLALVASPFYILSQVFHTAGNIFKHLRNFMDGLSNFVSSAIAWVDDKVADKEHYGEKYPRLGTSLKAMAASTVQLVTTAGIPLLGALEKWLAYKLWPAGSSKKGSQQEGSVRGTYSTVGQQLKDRSGAKVSYQDAVNPAVRARMARSKVILVAEKKGSVSEKDQQQRRHSRSTSSRK